MKQFFILFIILINIFSQASFLHADNFFAKQKKFIIQLYNDKMYFDAASETRKLIAYRRAPAKQREYEYFILGNYYYGGQYKSVLYNLSRRKEKLNLAESLLLASSYLKAGFYNESYISIREIQYSESQDLNYTLLLRRIEPLVYIQDFDTAISDLNAAKPFISSEEYIDLKSHLSKHDEISYRYPVLSGILSAAIPGAGQVYSGKIIPGIISFLGVAAAAAGTWYFNENGNREMAYSMAFFTVLFYSGNIYSGYNSASSSNLQEEKKFFSSFKSKYFNRHMPLNDTDIKRIFND